MSVYFWCSFSVFDFRVIVTNFFICFFGISRSDLQMDLSSMARTLYRYKSADVPPSPQTAADLKIAFENPAIMDRFGRSWVTPGETASDFFRGVQRSNGHTKVFQCEKVFSA